MIRNLEAKFACDRSWCRLYNALYKAAKQNPQDVDICREYDKVHTILLKRFSELDDHIKEKEEC